MFQLHVFANRVDHFVELEAVNLDVFTETFNMNFYFNYLTRWPECCAVACRKYKHIKTRCQSVEASAGLVDVCAEVAEADRHIAGYIIGKVEGAGPKQLGASEAKPLRRESRCLYLLFFRSIALYIFETLGCCIFISLHALLQQRHVCFDFRLLAIHV